VALQRGPIVFAAEWADNPGGRVRNSCCRTKSHCAPNFACSAQSVEVLQARAVALSRNEKGNLIGRRRGHFHPYYAWANRAPAR